MTHIALVLGNGFDIDLGLHTKYSEFADPKNKEWNDFLNMTGTIIKQCFCTEFVDHMLHARKHELWFDIETEILKFANEHTDLSEGQIGLIRRQYETLANCLRIYIYRQTVTTAINECSLAKNLLNKLSEIKHPVGIYSFNYTNCIKLCNCNNRDCFKLHPIHGTLFYDMTLGCRAYNGCKENTQLDFLYKPTIDFQNNILRQNLTSATEVIIFGHSLNNMDYCYFKDFFDAVESGRHICRHLTIICKDVNSENQIMENLKKNISVDKIKLNIDLIFMHTDLWLKMDVDTMKKYEDLCNRIS